MEVCAPVWQKLQLWVCVLIYHVMIRIRGVGICVGMMALWVFGRAFLAGRRLRYMHMVVMAGMSSKVYLKLLELYPEQLTDPHMHVFILGGMLAVAC